MTAFALLLKFTLHSLVVPRQHTKEGSLQQQRQPGRPRVLMSGAHSNAPIRFTEWSNQRNLERGLKS